MDDTVGKNKIHRSCDSCRSRKVRCSGHPAPCKTCTLRNTSCHFSRIVYPPRRKGAIDLKPATVPETPEQTNLAKRTKLGEGSNNAHKLATFDPITREVEKSHDKVPKLYVDRLLEYARDPEQLKDDSAFGFRENGLFCKNYSLTFFSEGRLRSLSVHLKNERVNELVQRISSVLKSRMKRPTVMSDGIASNKRSTPTSDNKTTVKAWIDLYFERVHCVFPFLDRKSFEATAFGPNLQDALAENKAWSALYHCVLALGSQYAGGGSFEPGKGDSWRLFSISLSLFPEILILPDSIIILQAVTAMAVYGLGIQSLSIERIILSEGARRAHSLGQNNYTGATAEIFQRNFWVLYSIEKISNFYLGRRSLFVDNDIGYPIPYIPEAIFEGWDWFLSLARHSRLLSRALTHLFSVGTTGKPNSYYLAAIEELRMELNQWQTTIPGANQPKSEHSTLKNHPTKETPVVLWTHVLHSGCLLILAQAALHLDSKAYGPDKPSRLEKSKNLVMEAARSILELTPFIDVHPSTPLLILGVVPAMALFVIFDLVIKDPLSPETNKNLALLDIAGGHFSRIEYATGGSLPVSLIAEFAHIARSHVNEINRRGVVGPTSKDLGATLRSQNASSDSYSSNEPLTTMASGTLNTSTNFGPMQILDAGTDNQIPSFTSYFQVDDNFSGVSDALLMGTDVMDLFHSFIPGVDPMFLQ